MIEHYEGTCVICQEPLDCDWDPKDGCIDKGIEPDGRVFTWIRHLFGPEKKCHVCTSRVYFVENRDAATA